MLYSHGSLPSGIPHMFFVSSIVGFFLHLIYFFLMLISGLSLNRKMGLLLWSGGGALAAAALFLALLLPFHSTMAAMAVAASAAHVVVTLSLAWELFGRGLTAAGDGDEMMMERSIAGFAASVVWTLFGWKVKLGAITVAHASTAAIFGILLLLQAIEAFSRLSRQQLEEQQQQAVGGDVVMSLLHSEKTLPNAEDILSIDDDSDDFDEWLQSDFLMGRRRNSWGA
eukprot:TRINITY_DN9511_c0_g1_i1.p1 TRINITY_DN9511_c0_g1~~TRINITY_DN9511_c0_g1_i1.p1  ORF type:complete len:226 (+),score=83.12 TRINITY_DN9511_c0_g1_i1:1-678(+)